MAAPSSVAASVFRTIVKTRRSSRRFEPNRKIPNAVLKDILESTQTAPSGFNIQPTHVMLVRSHEIKSSLAQNAMLGFGNIQRVHDSAAVAVFLSDLEPHKRLDRIVELEKDSGARNENYLASLPIAATFLMGEGHMSTWFKKTATNALSAMQPMPTIDSVESWSYKNTAIMAQTLVLAAVSHGLGTCMMEGYDVRRTRQILRIPDRYAVPLMVVMGYEYDEGREGAIHEVKKTPRLKKQEVMFGDVFGEALDLWDHPESTKLNAVQSSDKPGTTTM